MPNPPVLCDSAGAEEAVEHRAGMVADLARRTTRAVAGDWWVMSLSARSSFPSEEYICGTESDAQKSEARGSVLAGMHSHFVGFRWRPLSSSFFFWKPAKKACVASCEPPTVPSSRMKAVIRNSLLTASAFARPSEMALWRPRVKRRGPGGSLYCTPSCSGSSRLNQAPLVGPHEENNETDRGNC